MIVPREICISPADRLVGSQGIARCSGHHLIEYLRLLAPYKIKYTFSPLRRTRLCWLCGEHELRSRVTARLSKYVDCLSLTSTFRGTYGPHTPLIPFCFLRRSSHQSPVPYYPVDMRPHLALKKARVLHSTPPHPGFEPGTHGMRADHSTVIATMPQCIVKLNVYSRYRNWPP